MLFQLSVSNALVCCYHVVCMRDLSQVKQCDKFHSSLCCCLYVFFALVDYSSIPDFITLTFDMFHFYRKCLYCMYKFIVKSRFLVNLFPPDCLCTFCLIWHLVSTKHVSALLNTLSELTLLSCIWFKSWVRLEWRVEIDVLSPQLLFLFTSGIKNDCKLLSQWPEVSSVLLCI